MAFTRVYIPSRIIIHALSRPLPSQCRLVRATAFSCRDAHTSTRKASKQSKSNSNLESSEQDPNKSDSRKKKKVDPIAKELGKFMRDITDPDRPPLDRDLTDEEINDPNMPEITYYERDLDNPGPDVLVKRIATPEDRRKERDMWRMHREAKNNPDYDRYHLRHAVIDEMLVDPRFEEFADELKGMKKRLMTKEQIAEVEKKAVRQVEEQYKAMQSEITTATDEGLEQISKDPDFEDALPELNAYQEALTRYNHDTEHPKVVKALENLETKLSAHPGYRKEYAKLEAEMQREMEAEKEFEAQYARAMAGTDSDDYRPLLAQMRDLMAAMGGTESETVQAEIDQLLSEKTEKKEDEAEGQSFDFNSLSNELPKLTETKPVVSELDGSNHIDPSLQAKVDKILADPNLLGKLMHLQRAIEQAKQRQPFTQIPHAMAPDPETLPAHRTTPLQERIKMARDDPEHAAALAKLHVELPPPFNISPALRAFNQAIELAYVGANEDVRRILWRAYMKVRTLPTFLMSVPDDVWDLLYYSQAVTWKTNRNRESHLALLLQDLSSVGKQGPPTHPSTLANNS